MQKLTQRVTAFQVLNEVLKRDSRTSETRRPAHDFGVDHDDWFQHPFRLAGRQNPWSPANQVNCVDHLRPPRGFAGFHLKRKMRGEHNLLFGLTNDAFGYILTKVDFDSFPAYKYISRTSLGEMTGEILMQNALELIKRSGE